MDKASSSNLWYYNKDLQSYANALRKDMTKAEACLWKYVLKAKRMRGYSFRRQRPISNFIADFMCKELMLVIEVDGITHEWEETQIKDKLKQAAFTDLGFALLRFTDEDVLSGINEVANRIEQFIDEFENKINHPLNPPPAGENYHGIQLH